MKTLDFLFYFFVRWFQVSDRRTKKTVSYADQAAYALTICSIFWVLFLDLVFDFVVFKTFKSKIPNVIFIIVGLLIYLIYRHIYIKKGRYNRILERSDPKFNVSDKTGRIIAVAVAFSSLLILMLTTIVLHNVK